MFHPRLRQSEIFQACAPYLLSGGLHSRVAGAAHRGFRMAGAQRQHRIRVLAAFYERPVAAKSVRSYRIWRAGEFLAGSVSGPSGIALAPTHSKGSSITARLETSHLLD